MRSDYGLYGVAIICFIIAAAFAASLVPGYTLAEAAGVTITVIFILLGIISGAVGYSARPKAMMPPMRATPMKTSASEMPPRSPAADVSQTSQAPIEPAPAQPIEETPAPENVAPAMPEPEPSPPEEVTTPEPATTSPAEPEPPEEKPKEKTVRRRRRKTSTTDENTE